MGKGSSKLSPKELSDLTKVTNFNEVEVHDWYKGFMKVSGAHLLNIK